MSFLPHWLWGIHKMYGQILFSAQAIAMVFCLFPLSLTLPKSLTIMLLVLIALLTVWTLSVNRLNNWSVFPKPLDHAKLITSGPYGLVRHPMYSIVMLYGITCVLHNQTLSTLLSLIILILVLRVKAGYEERFLQERFEEYSGYMRRVSKRFMPGFF